MKKTIYVIAVLTAMVLVGCNNSTPAPENANDTTTVDTVAVDSIYFIDTVK